MRNSWLGDYYFNILQSPEAFRAALDQYIECPDETAIAKLEGVLRCLLGIVLENHKPPIEICSGGCNECIVDCLNRARKCDCSPAKYFTVVMLRHLRQYVQPTAAPSDKDFNWFATINDGRICFSIPVHPYNLPEKLASQSDVELLIINDGSPFFTPFSRWLSSSYKYPQLADITITCYDKEGKIRKSVLLQDAKHTKVSMLDPEYFSSSTLGMEIMFNYRKALYDDEKLLARHGQSRKKTQAQMATREGA